MKKLLLILLLLISCANLFAQPVYQIDNLDFEKGELGGEPFPWRFPQSVEKFGYKGFLTDSISHSGRFSFIMKNPNSSFDTIPADDPNECTVHQNVDPTYYLNKKVRFSIYAKLDSKISKARVEMWIVSKEGKSNVNLSYFDTINIIKGNNWEKFTIEAKIPSQSTELRFGILLVGGGTLIVDNASFDIVNPDAYKLQNSVNLNLNQLQNINNLAKIYSSMKYFLPSDKSVKTDWNHYLEYFLSNNVNNSEKVEFLEKFISPYKDAVYISENGKGLDNKIDKFQPNQLSYAMLYRGIPNPLMNENGNNYRKNIYSTTRRREGAITFMTDLIKYSGKELRISTDIKVNSESPGANAQLWARADVVNSKEFVSKTTANEPVNKDVWQKRYLFIDLPENLYRVKIALVFLGEGTANFDNIKMEIYDKGKLIKKIDEYNLDFEAPSNLNKIKDWEIEEPVISAGYSFDIDKSNPSNGKNSLIIKSDKNRVFYPEEGAYMSLKLSQDKSFNINVCAFTQNGKTIPPPKDEYVISEPDSIFRNWEDVNARISALIQSYSLLINFGANEINQNDLDSSFVYNLSRIVSKNTLDGYLSIFNNFLLVAKDSRSRFWNSFATNDYGIPLIFKKVEGKYLVMQNFDDELPISIGDEIISIDEVPIGNYLDSLAKDFYSSNTNYKLAKAGAITRAGTKNSEVVLTIRSQNNSVQKIGAKRTRLLNEIFEQRPPAFNQFNDSTLYIDMTEVSDTYMKEILDRLDGFKHYIFDLRGESVMSEHLLSLFSDTIIQAYNWVIPYYTHPFKKNTTREVLFGVINPKNKFKNKKVYFLINERSTGYSDFIARIIKKNKFGLLIGTETQGNPSELAATKLSGGFSISLSSILSIDDNNKVILDDPVKPDILVDENLNTVLNNKDFIIEKVLEIISKH